MDHDHDWVHLFELLVNKIIKLVLEDSSLALQVKILFEGNEGNEYVVTTAALGVLGKNAVVLLTDHFQMHLHSIHREGVV